MQGENIMGKYRYKAHKIPHLRVHRLWVRKYRYHLLLGDISKDAPGSCQSPRVMPKLLASAAVLAVKSMLTCIRSIHRHNQ